jgi:hypothetical protein
MTQTTVSVTCTSRSLLSLPSKAAELYPSSRTKSWWQRMVPGGTRRTLAASRRGGQKLNWRLRQRPRRVGHELH